MMEEPQLSESGFSRRKSITELERDIDNDITNKSISRPLRTDEEVYFIEGNRHDYKPESIIVVSKHHYSRLDDLIRNYKRKIEKLVLSISGVSAVVVILLIMLVKIHLTHNVGPFVK